MPNLSTLLPSMRFQDSNNVSITGGSAVNLTNLSAANITATTSLKASNIYPNSGTANTGTLLMAGGDTASFGSGGYIAVVGNSAGTDPGSIKMLVGSATGAFYNISIAGTNRFRLFDSGNVVIGNTMTDNGNRLQVQGATSLDGNLTLLGTSRRILADFSNASGALRTYFQSYTADSNTVVGVIPSGTANSAYTSYHGSSDLSNYSRMFIGMNSALARINCDSLGTGITPDLEIQMVGVTTARVYSSGRWYFGSSAVDDGVSIVRVGGNLTTVGDISLSGSARRITGDFTNATHANRVLVQSSTTNGATSLGLAPNGTASQSATVYYNSSDVANSSILSIGANASTHTINSTIAGTGSYNPMYLQMGGATRIAIFTTGRVGINTTTDDGVNTFQVAGSTSIAGNLDFSGSARRITGDMSGSTIQNRVAFQTSIGNSATYVGALPSGTATDSAFQAFGNSNPTNTTWVGMGLTASAAYLRVGISGTGSTLPLNFMMGVNTYATLFTSGNWGFGATSEQTTGFSATNPNIDISKLAGNSTIAMRSYNAGSPAVPVLNMGKSRGAVIGTLAVTSANDVLGVIAADGVSTSNAWAHAARIVFSQNGAAAASQVGGDIGMFVSDGTNAPVERFRLFGSGRVYIGSTPTDDGVNLLRVNGAANFNGDVSISGSARRIQADFSSAVSTRTFFQTSTTNSGTFIGTIPNGTSTGGGVLVFDNSNPDNSGYIGIGVNPSGQYLRSAVTGTGTLLPLDFQINTTTYARMFTSGNWGFGTLTEQATAFSGGLPIIDLAKASGNAYMSLRTYANNAVNNSAVVLSKSRGVTEGSLVTTLDNDALGTLSCEGVNTSNGWARPASIIFRQDGAAGASFVGGEIEFHTATNAAIAAVRATINSAGNFLVGTQTDLGTGYKIQASHTGTCIVSANNSVAGTQTWLAADATGSGITAVGAFPLRFVINGSEAARFFSTGNLGLGVTTEQTVGVTTQNPAIDVARLATDNAVISARVYGNNASGSPFLNLGKSRGATIGALAATQNGDNLGYLSFDGVTSSNSWASAGRIIFTQIGASGATNVRSDMRVWLSDGTNTASEVFRIFGTGRTFVGASATDDGVSTLYVNGITSVAGNINLPGSGRRFLANMSDATPANRFAFQTFTTDSATTVSIIPNGTSQISQLRVVNTSGYTNGAVASFGITSASAYLDMGFVGSGSALPFDLAFNGTARMRAFTSGRFFFGTSAVDDGVNMVQISGTASATSPAATANNTQLPTTAWVRSNIFSGKITVSTTAPSSPAEGDIWVDIN